MHDQAERPSSTSTSASTSARGTTSEPGNPATAREAEPAVVALPQQLLHLQSRAGNAAVQTLLAIQRDPEIVGRRQGRQMLYSVRNWHVGWTAILTRLRTLPDFQPITAAFRDADLVPGRPVTRNVTLRDGRVVRWQLDPVRGAGREGETRLVDPTSVACQFHRGADLEDALGVAPGGITPEAVATANRDRRALQQRLDNHVFEVLVHELAHALLLLERTTTGARSNTTDERRSFADAARDASAMAASRELRLAVRLTIGRLVSTNVPLARRAEATTALANDAAISAERIEEWLLDERVARNVSDRAVSSMTSNTELAGSYANALEQRLRAKVAEFVPSGRTQPDTDWSLGARIAAWWDAIDAVRRRAPAGTARMRR